MTSCRICRRPKAAAGFMCGPCQQSFERMKHQKDGSIMSCLIWAADRARRFTKSDVDTDSRSLRA